MRFNWSRDLTPARYALGLIALFCLLIISNTTANGQTSGRPMARMISSSQPSVAGRSTLISTAPRVAASASRLAASSAVSTTATAAADLERRAFDLVNARRRASGQTPLVWDEELTMMARGHSQNMATRGFFAHADPNGVDMTQRARSNGIQGWRALAENIAYNQGFDDPAAFAVERWMISTCHRDNILNSTFTRTGIGVVRAADGRVFFTQVFLVR